MKIAVISDIHDHLKELDKALQVIKQQQCESMIFCGDLCSPFVVPLLLSASLPIHGCFGNNDEDQGMIIENSKNNINWWPLAKEYAEVENDHQKIAFCHYPKLAKFLASTEQYAAVFHGHTHAAYQEKIGSTLLANPGAICGIQSGRPGQASFGIYDTNTNKFTHISI